MKFRVTSRVPASATIGQYAAPPEATQEINLPNPKATLQHVKALCAAKFRLTPFSFTLVYEGTRDDVSLGDDRRSLTECGLQDGDALALIAKRRREGEGVEDDDAMYADHISDVAHVRKDEDGVTPSSSSPTNSGAPPGKSPRTETADSTTRPGEVGGTGAGQGATAGHDTVPHTDAPAPVRATADELADRGPTTADNVLAGANEDGGDEDEEGESEMEGAEMLQERLMTVVPNLVEMRQEFVANPQAVMQRVQREDPTLFQLIAANQETFVNLMNDEEAVQMMQMMREGDDEEGEYDDDEEGEYDDDDEDSVDEETTEALHNLYLQMLDHNAGAHSTTTDAIATDGAHDGVAESSESGGVATLVNKEAILAYAPSEEDERKIQELTQLGFSYNQAKIAFYVCHRSLERAANYLFESPPQL